jgi:site-specific recombinase XerD
MNSSVVITPRIQKEPICTRWQISRVTSAAPRNKLGLDHVRDYQVHLFRTRRLKAYSVTVHLAALRFVFVAVLKRQWPVTDTPYPKKPDTMPTVLSQEEVTRLIDAAVTPIHRLT